MSATVRETYVADLKAKVMEIVEQLAALGAAGELGKGVLVRDDAQWLDHLEKHLAEITNVVANTQAKIIWARAVIQVLLPPSALDVAPAGQIIELPRGVS